MGDYVLKMCNFFFSFVLQTVICNVPAKNHTAVLQHLSTQLASECTPSWYPRLNIKKKKKLFPRAEFKITFKLKISTLKKAIILHIETYLRHRKDNI